MMLLTFTGILLYNVNICPDNFLTTAVTSRISIPENAVFTAVAKGIGTSISFEKNGKLAEAFDSPGADNIIELNGMKSKLVICTLAKEV